MLTDRIKPSDIVPDLFGGLQTWEQYMRIPQQIVLPLKLTARYADPLDAFCDVLPLSSRRTIEIRVPVNAPGLSTYYVNEWQPEERWHCVALRCAGREIFSVCVHFTDVPEHYYPLKMLCLKERTIVKAEERVPYTGDDRHRLRRLAAARFAATPLARKAYEISMEPQIMMRLALSEHVLEMLLGSLAFIRFGWHDVRETKNHTVQQWRRCYDEFESGGGGGDNGKPLAVYRAIGSMTCCNRLYNALMSGSREFGWQKNVDWNEQHSPVDRCPVNWFLYDSPVQVWRDGHQWLTGALARTPYMASLMCDMMLGFGVANLLPPYVLLEIFDWHESAERWTHFTKITMIVRIHTSIKKIAAKRRAEEKKKSKKH
jgi:hypothetical protein